MATLICATKYESENYGEPSMFVLRSLDGGPLATAARIRAYHGFGSPRVLVNGIVYEVDGERVIEL